MSIHRNTIDLLCQQLPNAYNNHYGHKDKIIKVDGRIPDIIIVNGELLEAHEVEILHKRGLADEGFKRILWIAIKGEWDDVQIINGETTKKIETISLSTHNLELSYVKRKTILENEISALEKKLLKYEKRIAKIANFFKDNAQRINTLNSRMSKSRWDDYLKNKVLKLTNSNVILPQPELKYEDFNCQRRIRY